MKLKKLITVLGCASIFGMVVACSPTPAHTHSLTHHDAVAAQCTVEGNKEYWSCSGCSKLFSDENGKNETTEADVKIGALGHSMTKHDAVPGSDCKHTGTIEYWSCSRCQKNYKEQAGTTVVTDLSDKTMGAHTLTHHVAAPSTDCQHTGTIEYWSCSVCEKNFKDQAASQEAQSLDDGVYGPHDPEKHEATAATCEVAGNSEYYSCKTEGCGKYFSDAACTTEIQSGSWVISPLNHDMDTAWEKDVTNHWHKCKRQGCTHVEDQAAHSFGTQEPQLDAENNVYKTCSVCGKVVLGKATVIALGQDYTDNNGFHYKRAGGEDYPFAVNTVLKPLNPSCMEANFSGLADFKIRTTKIASFLYNAGFADGAFLNFNGAFICQYEGAYYALEMPGQVRTAGKTKVITSEISEYSFRVYNTTAMIDLVVPDLGFAGDTGMSWTVSGDFYSRWEFTLTHEGVTTDISNKPSTNQGLPSGKEVTEVNYYATPKVVRIGLNTTKLAVGDIFTIKAGTAFANSGKTEAHVVLEDIALKFDGTMVCEEFHSDSLPTTMEHWTEMGQLRFDDLRFLEPYEKNTSFYLNYYRGVQYKPAGGSAADVTDLNANYWNKIGTFNGIWFHAVNNSTYAQGDQLIFADGSSFMMFVQEAGDANYIGRFYLNHGFAIEYNGASWELAK